MKKTLAILFATLIGMLTTSANAANGGAMHVICDNLNQELTKLENWMLGEQIPEAQLKQIKSTNTSQATLTVTKIVKTPIQSNPWSQIYSATTSATETKTLLPNAAAQYLATRETSHNLINTLTQVPFAMYNKDSDEAKTVENQITAADGSLYQDYAAQNKLSVLTTTPNAAASDTLYIGNPQGKDTVYEQNKLMLEKPTALHDDTVDFAKLISSQSYSAAEEASAKQFVKYAANSVDDFTKNINFSDLFNRPQALLNLKNSEVYQRYVFSLRSLLALRSMVTSTVNNLIAERTPMQGLGAAAGLDANTPASPLQVEAYRANHRIESSDWYDSLQNMQPATLQRQTIVILAEIEHQNYEAHLDRERIEGELAALALQGASQANANFMLQETSAMNTAIADAIKPPATPKAQTTSPTQATPTATAGSTNTTSTDAKKTDNKKK